METMTSYPVTPQTQTSHLRHHSLTRASNNPAFAQSTRSLQAADSQPAALSAPASQESFVSVQSTGSSIGPHLQSSSSNLSQLTNYTDPMSPVTFAPRDGFQVHGGALESARRAKTPDGPAVHGEYALASPMSLTSPVATNGAKRTASGHVKNAPSLPSTPMTGTIGSQRSRAESMSSTGSRAGELAASLKTRLGYAMAKVQHGWEHKNLAEVEQLATQKMSPNRHSMSHVDYSRRPVSAGLSNGTARLSMYDSYGRGALDGTISPPSKRRSGNFSSYTPASQQGLQSLTAQPHLQPPADIRPTTSSRHYHSIPSSQNSQYTNVMSPPRTPVNGQSRRPPTLRTDTQTAEAEREALQALFQLGSPHASQVSRHTNASQASSSQTSPLRTERRVTFARSESESSVQGSSAEGSLADPS